jgi:hypothetical protein
MTRYRLKSGWTLLIAVVSALAGTRAATADTAVSLTPNVNVAYTDGATFPSTGGIDGVGSAYSSTLLGSSLAWSGTTFTFAPADQLNGARNKTVTLPAGQFTALQLLGTGVNGDQLSQSVRVNYTDGTSATFTQTFSNWLNASQNVAGQSIAKSMAYRNKSTGVKDNRVFNLYGYSFALTSTKTVSSLVLPANNNVSILAATLKTGGATPTATTARATATATRTPTATSTRTPTATSTTPPTVVTLYQDCNLAGVPAAFGVGNFTTADLTAHGGQNNWASSLTVASGYCATLYDGDNLTGGSVSISGTSNCLVDNSFNDLASSMKVAAGACPAMPAPPATWQEHWFEHVQLLKLMTYNDDVAVYFDNDVNSAAQTWILDYVTRMWRYVKATYGNLNQTRLFTIHHTNKYFGGHPAYWYDASHDNRNVSDVGLSAWTTTPDYAIVTHETGHVVESVAHGKKGSPPFGVWGDSKWAEFYIYDIYVALGMTNEANAAYNDWTAAGHVDSFPRANTQWFRDWFYPLWRDHGHAQVMVNFFRLEGQYFPVDSNGNFTRGMNMGEFVHFMSGAAGTNLKAQATTAFGWPADYETQFNNARAAFPQITY